MLNKESLIEDTKDVILILCDFKNIDERMIELKNEMEVVCELSTKMISENMHKAQSQDDYTKKYEELLKRYEKANVEYSRLQNEKLHKVSLAKKLESFINEIENNPIAIGKFERHHSH